MSSEKKLSKKEHIKMLEQTIVNHSFIIDALINILIENGVCSFDDIKGKIDRNAKIIEEQLKNQMNPPSEDETPIMNYFGPMGEA
jgi:hypothetical protein